MIEALSLTVGAVLALSWYYVIGISLLSMLVVVSVLNECVEFSLGTLLVLGGVLHYTGVIDVTQWNLLALVINVSIYLVIGLFWSFFRYRLKAIEIIKDHDFSDKNKAIQSIKNKISKSLISYWILFFPISILKFITEDLIDWLVEQFQGVYTIIAKHTVGSYLK